MSEFKVTLPIKFSPNYKHLVWGGRRIGKFRPDFPSDPDMNIGESWDLADHEGGMTWVSNDEYRGESIGTLMSKWGKEILGKGFVAGERFPYLLKLIDANQCLSVQVHPSDEQAEKMNLSDAGKQECWLVLAGGGYLYQGLKPGVDSKTFESAVQSGTKENVEALMNRYDVSEGDFFFLQAGTVHALGSGCFLYEIQQTSDMTFRAYDWGRVGLDGKPRELHLAKAMEVIDFGRRDFGPLMVPWEPLADTKPCAILERRLVSCSQFSVRQIRFDADENAADIKLENYCLVITCTKGSIGVRFLGPQSDTTQFEEMRVTTMETVLIPATVRAVRIRNAESENTAECLLTTR